ncbi:MAG: hypothetical protein HC898_04565 [Phycisphaerales bacterium]|nr:hypothetical protein [Phycisphaerales bacterium]
MRLGKWLAEENWTLVQGLAETIITGVSDDSRKVEPGMLFIARSGVREDGAKYLMEALARGARAVLLGDKAVLPEEVGQSAGAAVVRCKGEPDVAMVGRLAEKFYGEPSKQLQLVGITGTKGKTTVAYLIQQLLGELAGKCGMIGTICIDDGKKRFRRN